MFCSFSCFLTHSLYTLNANWIWIQKCPCGYFLLLFCILKGVRGLLHQVQGYIKLRLLPELHIHISKCLLGMSSWMSCRFLKSVMSQTEAITFFPDLLPLHSYVNGSTVYPATQARGQASSLTLCFHHQDSIVFFLSKAFQTHLCLFITTTSILFLEAIFTYFDYRDSPQANSPALSASNPFSTLKPGALSKMQQEQLI